jgi:hypothetical protein
MLQTGLRVGEVAALSIAKTAPQRAHYRTRCYLTALRIEGQLFSEPPPRLGYARAFAALEPENPSSIPHPLRAALQRVDQEIQHMLENARLLAKAA